MGTPARSPRSTGPGGRRGNGVQGELSGGRGGGCDSHSCSWREAQRWACPWVMGLPPVGTPPTRPRLSEGSGVCVLAGHAAEECWEETGGASQAAGHCNAPHVPDSPLSFPRPQLGQQPLPRAEARLRGAVNSVIFLESCGGSAVGAGVLVPARSRMRRASSVHLSAQASIISPHRKCSKSPVCFFGVL